MADYITIAPVPGTWVVRAGGAVLAETIGALELKEGDYPPVIYFPRDDIAMAFLEKTDKTTVCPHKGTASYYAIHAKSGIIEEAGWSYEDPKPEVEAIREYLAFYPNKVTVEQL
ncbi:DUF427 domain-containing protein [Pseudoruegeria sp. SHC-113]|uniref:DUF427 domain-containing protein n=1 Tax=Pseudoruegeria sp. SHC-113 TaxID=2855439 RepID=UPI0021BBA10E|nr:DUF427 domain-containing protein [Pseudoruegeria sp. SHC-113]MCT8161020.1 DUF427 domain-containing protein [Pseudoruegeria sp. SHC-113]